jgi:endonuclease/exonuclease/phosphatase family metal-dependent hydrolase
VRKLAGKIILYSNILLALCLLLSYTAPIINPAKLLLPAFFGLAYPYLLFLNLIFLIYWIVRMRKELLISLVVILLGLFHLTNLVPLRLKKSPEPRVESNSPMKVLSYNVRTFDKYNWSQNSQTKEGIFETIRTEDPSIVCIQEFYTSNKSGKRERDIRNQLKEYPYYSIYYSLKSGASTGFGIATFSKYPIVKTNRIPFDNTINQAVYTDILIDNDTVRMFNIHLQSIQFGQRNYAFLDSLSLKYTNKQLEEVKDIGSRLKEAFVMRAEQSKIIHHYIEESEYPVIVAGDFNDTPVSYAYKRIKKGLSDAFRTSGKGLGNTYAGELPSFRIDYIFYSEELEAVEFERIKSKFSDHFPITSTLQFTAEPATE